VSVVKKKKMKAYRILELGKPPVLKEIYVPYPGQGELLIRMGGAGLCRTDLEVIDHGIEILPWKGPFTLGHENAGWVEILGPGVTGFEVGEAVISSCIHSCGHCEACLLGNDNYCESASARGLAEDGGLAEYMIADQRQLISLGSIDPGTYAPLSDAALTPYGAVDHARCKIPGNGIAVVIGIGGLGYYAVQFLRELTSARIIAVDISPERLDVAKNIGASDLVISDAEAMDKIMRLSEGKGVHAAFDFVGNDISMNLCAKVTRCMGIITVNGLGGGTLNFSWGNVKPGVDVRFSQGGSLAQMRSIIDLVRRDKISVEVQAFEFHQLYDALDALRNGKLKGRAVIKFAKSDE
jgi:propanol-preferring alcohol dehydrogenase